MKIVYIIRRKQPNFHSIERVFRKVSYHTAGFCEVKMVKMLRGGLSCFNFLHAFLLRLRFGRSAIFHITGDIHYLSLVLPKKRTLLTVHDCVFLNIYDGYKKYILRKMYLDWPLKHLKKVTVISAKTKAEIIEHCKAVRADITVIPNPLMPEFKFSSKIFDQHNPRILFVGTNENKNFDRAVEALKNLDCTMIVLGRLTDRHTELLKTFDIRYENYYSLTDTEVADLYAGSDLLLFPSLYEGFGLPVIEAFKTGKPVITSHISPMVDVAEGAAQLVDPYSVDSIKSGLLAIISNREYREALVKKGVVVAEKYDGEEVSRQYLAVYNELSRSLAE